MPLKDLKARKAYAKRHYEENKERYKKWAMNRYASLKPSEELIECACGCGTLIPKHDRLGRPHRFVLGHNLGKRSKHPEWREGKIYHQNGYVMVRVPEHPHASPVGYVMEHRLVMEKALERYLTPEEQVHHLNKVRDDNRIENLRLFPNQSAHQKYEWAERKAIAV